MRKSCVPSTQTLWFEPQRVAVFLRKLFPFATAKLAAKALGAHSRTVENWLSGDAQPSAAMIFKMIHLFGPEFLASVMTQPPAWLDRAKIAEERRALERQLADLDLRLQGPS